MTLWRRISLAPASNRTPAFQPVERLEQQQSVLQHCCDHCIRKQPDSQSYMLQKTRENFLCSITINYDFLYNFYYPFYRLMSFWPDCHKLCHYKISQSQTFTAKRNSTGEDIADLIVLFLSQPPDVSVAGQITEQSRLSAQPRKQTVAFCFMSFLFIFLCLLLLLLLGDGK